MKGYWKTKTCRDRVLLFLVETGRPAGLEEIRRGARIPDAPAALALLQLERAGLLIREPNTKRPGFLWRQAEVQA